MRVRKPKYYDKFYCIADKCPFTCCQEWKIGVDNDTYKNWCSMNIPSETLSRNAIASNTLDEFVDTSDENYSIKLCKNGLCPLLNKQGLCDVVLTYGEENISTTCHTYPRETHQFDEYVELTLAAGCPAVLELLWKEGFDAIEADADIDLEGTEPEIDEELFELRDFLINSFDSNKSIELNLKKLFYIMLDCFDNESVYTNSFDDAFLAELEESISDLECDYEDTTNEINELFLDMADNYRKKKIYVDVIEELAKLANEYEDAKADNLLNDRIAFDKYIRESKAYNDKSFYDLLFVLIKEEIFSTLLLPEGDLYSMTMKLQWIAISYAVIMQALFLKYSIDGKLDIDTFNKIVAVVIRMTGYSEEDIEEYLEDSFQDIIWEWGYMALIMGENV